MSRDRFQLLPPLSDEEYEALKADIEERGVLVPVEIDEESGQVLDGHHRVRACAELGIDHYPTVTRRFDSDEEREAHVLALNLARRHLDRDQRRELTARLRSRGWSTRRIAEVEGTSYMTVQRDLAIGTNVPMLLPSRIETSDGRGYPSTRPSIPREQRLEEQATANAVIDAAGDPEGRVNRAKLRFAYRDAAYAVRMKLLHLDPEAVADLLTSDEVEMGDWLIRDTVAWCRRFEQALHRGVRLITAQE